MRVLIIEDRQLLADEYIRIFGHILTGEHSYTHVSSIEAAGPPLAKENWDAILVDSEPGPGSVFPKGEAEEEGIKLNNGYDLVRFRRNIEDTVEGIQKSYIIGIASNRVALGFFEQVGADDSILKLFIPSMANALQSVAAGAV